MFPLVSSGAPFYTTYACSDGGLVAVGAIEAQVLKLRCVVASRLDDFAVLQGAFAGSGLPGADACSGANGCQQVRQPVLPLISMPVVVRSVIDCQCRWERTREVFAGIFIQKSQKEWCAVFDGTDACVTPVLRPEQLHEHPLHMARSDRLQNAIFDNP